MPRARSQYIAEMRERFEVVDRVKASAEEKASLTKAIEDERSSPEETPSKENTLPKDAEVVKLKFALEDDNEESNKDEDEDSEKKEAGDEIEEVDEDVESGLKVSFCRFCKVFLIRIPRFFENSKTELV